MTAELGSSLQIKSVLLCLIRDAMSFGKEISKCDNRQPSEQVGRRAGPVPLVADVLSNRGFRFLFRTTTTRQQQ